MENSIFNYKSYRQYMFDKLSAEGKRGQLSKALVSLGCQSSFLSRVIGEELHITPDHAYKLSQFWSLRGDERSYFLKLVDYDRAGDPDYRQFIKGQIDELKKKNSEISVRTHRQNKNFEGLSVKYFSSWLYGAIHFLTCIPEFQTLSGLTKRLHASDSMVKEILEDLEAMNFVKKQKEKWIYSSGEFHLERTSPLVLIHHQNWRQRAILDAQKFDRQSIHYTTVLTLSKSDTEKLQNMILDFLAEINRIAAPSQPEDEVILTCDFFKV